MNTKISEAEVEAALIGWATSKGTGARELMRSALEGAAVHRHSETPVATVGSMPGTDGFTMACFKADEVPVGTPLYVHPQPAELAEQQGYDDGTGRNRDWSGAATGKQAGEAQGAARAQFEAWAASTGWYAVASRPDKDAPYALNAVQFAWEAWQAALAARHPQTRDELIALAREAIRQLDVIDGHIDAAVEKCKEDLAASQPGAQDQREGCAGSMTDDRVAFFLRRFRREEKLLGPHEQWAMDVAISRFEQQDTPPAQVPIGRVEADADASTGTRVYWNQVTPPVGTQLYAAPPAQGIDLDTARRAYTLIVHYKLTLDRNDTRFDECAAVLTMIDGQRGAAGVSP